MENPLVLRIAMFHLINNLIYKVSALYSYSEVHSAIEYIEYYNKVQLKDVAVFGSSNFHSDGNGFIKNVYDIQFQKVHNQL